MLLALLLACTPPATEDNPRPAKVWAPTDFEDSPYTATFDVSLQPASTDELPMKAPATLLLAAIDYEGAVTVEGRADADVMVDVDTADDDRDAFRYAVLDADGQRLYERTRTSPVLVYDFLEHYSEASGYNILQLFPELGRFPLRVPQLDGATEVVFEVRDSEGVYSEVGRHLLGEEDLRDPSDVAVGSETLVDHGDPDHRLDIVLLGDGFTEDQQDGWRDDADLFTDLLLSTEPMASWSDAINVHRVDAISNESGASFDCIDDCTWHDTAFGSIFPLNLVNQLIGTDYTRSTVIQQHQWEVALAASTVPWDLALVLVNSEQSGGMAVHYATFSRDDEWELTGVHELGHLLGLLGDEYMRDECIISEPLGLPGNITDDPEDPPWAYWMDEDESVGTFSGAYNCDHLYRSAETCKMLTLESEFCTVCTEMLVRRLFRFVDPVDDLDVTVDQGRLVVAAEGIWPEAELTVLIDGEVAASGTVAEPPSIDLPPPEGHVIEVQAELWAPEVIETWGDLSESRSYRW